MKKTQILAWLLLLILPLLPACGGGGGDGASTGTLQVALTDNVDPGFSEVVISIREVRVVPAGDETDEGDDSGHPLIASFDPPLTVNVLDLAFQQEFLGSQVIAAGRYSQVRLVLEENLDPADPANFIVLQNAPDTKIPLATPSGQQSGLKIIGNIEVEADVLNTIVLDFDPARAVVEAGNSGSWILKPTGIRVVRTENVVESYGGISGQVVYVETDDSVDPPVTSEVPVSDAVFAVYEESMVAPVASGSVAAEDGTFRALVEEGAYRVVIEAPGLETVEILADVVLGEETALEIVEMSPNAL